MKNKETIANSLLHPFAAVQKRRRFDKQKIVIIGLWFLILSGIRILLGFALGDIWIGTFGAVAITFAVFCLIIRYTPLQRYRPKVNVILSQWYRRKYFLISTITISAILASLLVLIQFGYLYYGSNLVSINIFILEDKELEMSLLHFENYPFVDKIAIIVASTDKSLNGNYSKATSYLLAEDIEMTIFVLLARKKKNLFAI
jgi:hypothetical protein